MLAKNNRTAYKNIIALVIIGLLVVGGSLYWWTVRPYLASKSCHSMTLDNSGYSKENVELWMRNDNAQRNYMFVYEVCMHKEGLNP